MPLMQRNLILMLLCIVSPVFAAMVPGGQLRTGEGSPAYTYEIVVSPAYSLSPGGAYMTAELRGQLNPDFGTGVGFGAGEAGFNMGAFGVWNAVPDLPAQPAVSLLGGLYFNRARDEDSKSYNYFVVKFVPTISKTAKIDWGKLTPYLALPIAPNFRLGSEALNSVAIAVALGSEFVFQELKGLKVWTEVDIGVSDSQHEVIVGFAYPFHALGG